MLALFAFHNSVKFAFVGVELLSHKSFVKGRRPALNSTVTTTTTTTILMASRRPRHCRRRGRRGRRFVLAARSTKKGRRKIVRQTTVDTTKTRKKKIRYCGGFRCPTKNAPRRRRRALLRCRGVLWCGVVLFWRRGDDRERARFAVEKDPQRRLLRNLSSRGEEISSLYWRAK